MFYISPGSDGLVTWGWVFAVAIIIVITHVKCIHSWGPGLKIRHWRLAVKCGTLGLWMTISEPRYDGSMVTAEISSISKVLGAICSLQSSANLQKQPQHIPACLYPVLLRGLSLYSPRQCTCQPKSSLSKVGWGRGTIKLQILLNVSGIIKNVYYFADASGWSLTKAQHACQMGYQPTR